MRVRPKTAEKLNELAAASRRAPEDIVEDALADHFEEVASLWRALDSRYDDQRLHCPFKRDGPRRGSEAVQKLGSDESWQEECQSVDDRFARKIHISPVALTVDERAGL